MAPSVTITTLDSGQLPALRRMLSMFGTVFEDPQAYTGHPPDDAYLSQLLDRDTFIAIAALDGSDVVGGLAAYVLHKFEQQRSEIYLYDLAVKQAYRRQGVATALISALRRVARERGAYVILVQADRGDAPAIALYDKLGVQEDVLHFDIQP